MTPQMTIGEDINPYNYHQVVIAQFFSHGTRCAGEVAAVRMRFFLFCLPSCQSCMVYGYFRFSTTAFVRRVSVFIAVLKLKSTTYLG